VASLRGTAGWFWTEAVGVGWGFNGIDGAGVD
jgi:hypothetical protein